MKPGDRITTESGRTFVIGELLATSGPEDCQDARCSRLDGRCVGYHCPRCGEPCSSQGHGLCKPTGAEAA